MVSLAAAGGELRFGVAVVSKSMEIVRLAISVMLAMLDVMPPEDAVAVLVIEPASMSAWMIVCVEVQVVVAPGASEPVPHEIVPCRLSVTVNGPASVVFPLLVIM